MAASMNRLIMMRKPGLSGPVVQAIGGGKFVAKSGLPSSATPTPQLIFDFEDGVVPGAFTHAAGIAWHNTTVSAAGGSRSMRSSSGPDPFVINSSTSSEYIIGDFEAGDFSFTYRISSQPGSDFGYVFVDGALVVGPISGNGMWEQSPSIPLSAGVHIIQFAYVKDRVSGSVNEDFFYIDDVKTPPFVSIGNNLEYFLSGVPAGWTNDAVYPWIAPTYAPMPFLGARSPDIPANSTTELVYVSPSSSPEGAALFIGAANSGTSDVLRFFIDGVEVYNDSGWLYDEPTRGPKGAHQQVSVGSHEYRWTFSKGIFNLNGSYGYVNAFYEPSMGA